MKDRSSNWILYVVMVLLLIQVGLNFTDKILAYRQREQAVREFTGAFERYLRDLDTTPKPNVTLSMDGVDYQYELLAYLSPDSNDGCKIGVTVQGIGCPCQRCPGGQTILDSLEFSDQERLSVISASLWSARIDTTGDSVRVFLDPMSVIEDGVCVWSMERRALADSLCRSEPKQIDLI